MNELENRLTYPFGDQLPGPGASLEVAPGVRWIRMSLPFALNHINLWLLRDELERPDGSGLAQGWTVVDCCIDRPESRAQWEQVIANELQGLPVLRVIATHMHPDHLGLAHWLCGRFDARLWISSTDYHLANIASRSDSGWGGDAAARFLASHGLADRTSVAGVAQRSGYYSGLVPGLPRKYKRMQDGDLIRIGGMSWRCISGYGHAPEHIALFCEELKLLIGGDMMLPRISTNVSVFENEPESDPLKQFLDSIDKFRPLHADTLTLPSHGKPFRGLHERIEQLHAHHRDRLDEVMLFCARRDGNAHDMLPLLFKRKLDLHETTFAMGESIAHLHKLWFAGKLKRRLHEDGIYRFAAVQGQSG
jgi:glyoxylase-like metal-dependent hydrolase (beta-lactamase superfamily II)